ncbi:hypothetical protein SDJN03_05924, partial [Cucurbita argyrosperma subsp. sororia]
MASSNHLSEEEEEEIDSDDEFYQDGYHTITKKEEREYFRAVEESEGFDVPDFGKVKVFSCSLIIPIDMHENSWMLKEVRISANKAIEHYNKENGTNFEVVEIVKANHSGCCGSMYYITFNVKPIGTSTEFSPITFQAKVYYAIPIKDIIDVELCKPKFFNLQSSLISDQ